MLEISARLLRVLSLLQARRDWTSTELATRLGVTTRTIRNDTEGMGLQCGLLAQLERGTRRMIGSSRSVACW